MIDYFARYHDKLLAALWQHVVLVVVSLLLSLVVAAALVVACTYSRRFERWLLGVLAMLYAIPSLALLALLVPFTGLGTKTAVLVLVLYNQYLLLRGFTAGLGAVDPALADAATGMGMTKMQVLLRIRLPLAKRGLFAALRVAVVSTIGIATIAASINAGGLGSILFDGLRTMNVVKIVWGALLSAALAIVADAGLGLLERKSGNRGRKSPRHGILKKAAGRKGE